ncbi:MAG TPA: recombinase family protein [Candidatus Acidoferrum sp.]|jgi:site-specific DNA recombinase|nr:recombinase family protein [Candidatus Acidoferrum sp.]
MKDKSILNKPVGIWIRVSTEDQAQGDSPEHHEERARAYAKSKGWEVKEVYDLAGQSGKAVMQHPEAKRMMKDVERGHISGLVFSKLARLSRNRRELEDFAEFFDKHKADLMSLSEAIDTSTAGGRMFFHLLGVFAQWEREEITERVNASVLTRAKLGKSINGSAPYGYKWKDRKLVVQPEEALVRKKAYELFLQHRRKGVVSKFLNTAGYRTRNGSIWRDTSVLRILDESSAKGVYVFNTMRQTGNWRTEPKPESEWGKAECEPIVSEELWNEVNQIIEEQLKSWKKPGKTPVYLFSGLAHCSCGAKMYVRAGSPKYVCRKCCNKIPIVDLENIVKNELKLFFGQRDRVSQHLQNADRNLAEKTAALEIHRNEIQKVRDEMTRTHRLYLDGGITTQGFGEFYKPAEERLNQLRAELPKLEAEVDLLKVNKLSTDDVVHESATLHERWPKIPLDDKRKVVEALIEKLVIGDGAIDITYSCLPTSEELCKSQQGLGPG